MFTSPDTQRVVGVSINFGRRPRVRLLIKMTPYEYTYPHDKK